MQVFVLTAYKRLLVIPIGVFDTNDLALYTWDKIKHQYDSGKVKIFELNKVYDHSI